MKIKTSGYNWAGKTTINGINYKVGKLIFDKNFENKFVFKVATIKIKNKYYFCHLFKFGNKIKIGRFYKINKIK